MFEKLIWILYFTSNSKTCVTCVKQFVSCFLYFFNLKQHCTYHFFFLIAWNEKFSSWGEVNCKADPRVVFFQLHVELLIKMRCLPLRTIPVAREVNKYWERREVWWHDCWCQNFVIYSQTECQQCISRYIKTGHSCSLRLAAPKPGSSTWKGFFACLFSFCVLVYPNFQKSFK